MFVTGPRFALNYDSMTIPYEEVIERALTIVPVAKRNVAAAEELRRMPEENIRAILDSGLMPLMRPRMFGGYEGDPDPRMLTSFAPTGQITEVPGGLEVGGRWHYGSAGDYCRWAILGGV